MIKIVLFGANESTYQSAIDNLTSDCEIIAFCDNNQFKHNLIWNDKPIISINQLKHLDFDYVIVGAWYSYQSIRSQLLNSGIANDKILPLLSLKTYHLLTEPIDSIDEHTLKKIFKSDSQKLISGINELKIINELYNQIEPLRQSPFNFDDYPLIAHAGGGLIGNEKLIYTNSIEAFETSIANGYKMIEIDLFGEIDNDLIFAHDHEKLFNLATTNYHSLTFSYVLSKVKSNPKLKIMIDVKYKTLIDYQKLLENMDSMIDCNLKSNFVIQTYDEATTDYAVKNNWQCILMSYRNPQGSFFKKTAYLCCKYQLLGAIFNFNTLLKSAKYLKILNDKNIPILCYTVDNVDDVSRLRNLGTKSIVTNFLRVIEQ